MTSRTSPTSPRRRRVLAGLLAPAFAPSFAASPPAAAAADEILRRVRAHPAVQDTRCEVVLRLDDPDGGRRERSLVYLQKRYGADERLTLCFTGPADVRGVGLQSLNHDESDPRPDEQWIFLPAFRQVRRVAADDKRGAFMGSQFSYADLDRLRVGDFAQMLQGEERVLGRDCHVIERTARSDEVVGRTGYLRQRVWVDQERSLVLRQAYHDPAGLLFKQLDVTRVERIQDVWTVMESVMVDRASRRSSTLVFSDVRYDTGLDDALFRQDILKTGIGRGNLPAIR